MKKMLLMLTLLMFTHAAQAETISVSVNGLVCAFCATGIEKTFQKQPMVEKVKVDLDAKLVTIGTKEKTTMDDATILKLITDAGYSITGIKREQ